MLQTLIKVIRVFKNTIFLKDPVVQRTTLELMGGRLFFLFILNLIVPYGYFARYMLLHVCKKKSHCLVGMVDSGFFHAALRVITPEERLFISQTYSTLRNPGAIPVNKGEDDLPNGYRNLGKMVSAEDCAAVVSYLKSEKGFIGQVPMQTDGNLYSYQEAEKVALGQGRYFSYAPGTSWKHPVITGVIESDRVKKIVRANLGDNAEVFSLNTFIVFPGEKVDHYVMKMHRDYDDFNFIAFFVYWTGVTGENGATLFVPGTNTSSDSALLKHKIFLEGAPGDGFAFDSFGFHSGNNSVKTPRFVTWFRYGLKNNLAAAQNGWPPAEVKRRMEISG